MGNKKAKIRDLIFAKTKKHADIPEPKGKDLLIGDATVEAINQALVCNPRGLLLIQDEILGWINSMNAYRKGGDTEYFISTWSGQFVKVNRTGKKTMYIANPFLSSIGGIQPGKILALASGGNLDNGMIARFLFAWPDDMKKPEESNAEPKQDNIELYQRILNRIDALPNEFEEPEQAHRMPKVNRIEVPLDEEAYQTYVEFLNDYTRQMNKTEDEQIKSVLGKLQQYCLRISLIMEFLDISCNMDPKFGNKDWIDKCQELNLEYMKTVKIRKVSMERAIKLTEYFKYNGLKVIQRLESPVKALTHEQQIWYKYLPELEFTSQEAMQLGQELKDEYPDAALSERTLKRLFSSHPGLFTKKGRGRYEKNILT
ncbi:MAG: DUF3987 domain-containing protein [Bacteroidota bacterium]